MVQLNNTIKGDEMTPEEISIHDERIKQLPTIIELHKDLEGLKEGQESLKETVSDGFSKGKQRMDGIEGEVREVKNEVKELSRLIVSFFSEARGMNAELKDKISDQKYQDLKEEKKELQNEIKEGKKRQFDLMKIFLAAIASAFVSGLVVHFWPV